MYILSQDVSRSPGWFRSFPRWHCLRWLQKTLPQSPSEWSLHQRSAYPSLVPLTPGPRPSSTPPGRQQAGRQGSIFTRGEKKVPGEKSIQQANKHNLTNKEASKTHTRKHTTSIQPKRAMQPLPFYAMLDHPKAKGQNTPMRATTTRTRGLVGTGVRRRCRWHIPMHLPKEGKGSLQEEEKQQATPPPANTKQGSVR